MIKIENLKQSYLGVPVIKGLNLEIQKGELVFLQGSSGSGKSTFLKILNGYTEDFGGEVWIENVSIRKMKKFELRRITGTVYQSFELLERKTAFENVCLAGEVLGKSQSEIMGRAKELFEQVGLRGKEERYPAQLSGGEQQRVAIARALLNKPKILLADEPTGNLDPENAFMIMQLFSQINQQHGLTMLIVTHSKELVKTFPGRKIRMEGGIIREL
ncbi:ABC transporter ATP-binding protein [Bacillus salipaludis]|uniref:ABC transporter ATP-binding protein n=1 Tax=Bacillus salipaludis TaxID=2547811 RepID=A0A4R5VIU6_9BACI|nr:ABC transporter ATP-binding protein [Bacillus salipaludis]TDK55944.1 ABC transporter ATP-binding protein [Bacillus salipaludis]